MLTWSGIISIFRLYSLDLTDSFVQSTEHVVEENAARFTVNIVTIASFPELLQVICILQNLLKHTMPITAAVDVECALYGATGLSLCEATFQAT